MSFLKKLLGDKDEAADNKPSKLTPEEFLITKDVKELIEKHKCTTTLLRPHKANSSIGQNESKFGGTPNFQAFDAYPHCDKCDTPLNFVLQLYKHDFPNFYFPDNTDLFQLFRCPNSDCIDAYSEQYDLKMFHYYLIDQNEATITLLKPETDSENNEAEVPDCYLDPKVVDDFPSYDDYENDDLTTLENKYGEELSEIFTENYTAIQRTKFGGYPSFTQSPFYPTCKCGQLKEFFFQLSSEDLEDGIEFPPPHDQWSPHGIMIGDVGNIYYYVCKSCGQNTIESYWDCY